MDDTFSDCSLPPVPPREFPAGTDPARVEVIVVNESKWVSHTVLHYHFFDRETDGEHVFLADGTRSGGPGPPTRPTRTSSAAPSTAGRPRTSAWSSTR